MGKAVSIPFKEFMSGSYKEKIANVKEISKGNAYKIILTTGIVLIIFLTGYDIASAASDIGIEKGAEMIYKKLLLVGKWVIIVKGGMDTINNMLQGDHGAAKRNFVSYLVVYVILNGLPWALGQVDTVFRGM